jgi:hypothetical protein
MFYVVSLLTIIPSILGVIWIRTYLKTIGFVIVALLCCWRFEYQFNYGSIRDANASQLYSERILLSLPQNSAIIVDSDIVFDLLYNQLHLKQRQDVVVIPVGMVLQQNWWKAENHDFSHFGFQSNKQEFVADLVTTSLEHKRRVFLYGIEAPILSYLGLEGNPFYGIPHGYTLEVSALPPLMLEPYDFGLSVQLAPIRSDTSENWFKGFRAHLGGIHTQNVYYLARLGYETEALWHRDIANKLFYKNESSIIVDQSFDVGKERYLTLGSYLNYEPLPVSYWESQLPSVYFLSRAVLLQPLRIDLRKRLYAAYNAAGDYKSAQYQSALLTRLDH